MNNQELIARRLKTLGPTYQNFYDRPLHLVRGSGTALWDADGRQYVDCYNNVVSVGHCHPRVVEALCKQAATLNTHTRYLHEGIVELGEMLVERMPGDIEICIFTCTGSEANDLAAQVARHVSGQQGLIVTEASYHGVSELTRRLSTDSYPPEDRPDWLAVIEPPNLYRGPYHRDDPEAGARYLELARQELDRLEQRGYKPAAVMIDVAWDSNGPLLAPTDYVLGLCAEVRKRGGLVIADEVQSGYCRSGKDWWNCNNYGFQPDILTCGKPMGAGHPLALMATTRDVIDDYSRHYHYFNTFGGNPVSAAVGKAVIDVIESEGLLHNALETGAYLEAGLRELAGRHEPIGDVQGFGLFWGLDMVADRDSREPLSREQLRHLGSLIAEQGVITGTSGRYGQVLKLRPPLPFSRSDADKTVAAIDTALKGFSI
ncbi:MAG: aspartate aminotransferase family protein [Gammaproteobacteria bacterium]|nr:aspartate aminotransferase family protein [Gammaproteobacteria bacterium]